MTIVLLKWARSAAWFGIFIIASFSLWNTPSAYAVVNSTTFPAIKDSHIRQNQQIRNYGLTNQLRVQSRRVNRNHRTIMQFNISTVPAGATIEDATLRAYLRDLPDRQRIYDVHRVTNSWLEGIGTGGNNNAAVNGVTGIERWFGDNAWTGAGPGDWATMGGDFAAAPTASLQTPSAEGFMSWPVTADVDAWHTGTLPNSGWIIKDSAEDSPGRRTGRIRSRETGNPARRPALDVTYLRSGAVLSTDTVEAGLYAPMIVSVTNNAGPGGDQVNQVSFNVPAGWGQIPTVAGDYTITAPAGKTWNINSIPPAPDGPQTVTVTAATGADDLAAGETLDIIFSLCSPWISGTTNWTFSTAGAAGGTHLPADWTVLTTTGSLEFVPGSGQSMDSVSLTGFDTSTSGTLGTLSVRDARGTGGGWSVTVAATDFVLTIDPAQTISASGFSVSVAPAVTVVSGGSPPTAAAGGLAGVGLQLLNAPAGVGAGEYQVTPALELSVPAATISGTYSATITETIIAGP